MSFWSDLHAGDAERIGEALREGDAPESEAVVAHVNLPGILPAGEFSMEMLTTIVAETSFEEAVVEKYVDDGETGAWRMSDEWVVSMMAMRDAQGVAREFLHEGNASTDDEQVDALAALFERVASLCRTANAHGVAVVYSWQL